MEKQTGNFQEGIHTPDFWERYRERLLPAAVIADRFRETESLDGVWRYGIDQYDSCLRNRWFEERETDGDGRALPLDYSFDHWDTIRVPSCWNLHSEKLFLYEGSVVYTRKFSYRSRGEQRVFLKFGGANYRAAVFVNQSYLGLHQGGSTPFYVEVTGLLQAENRLLVVVNNTRRRGGVPADNTDWFNYGGLYRGVELIRLPGAFIRSFSAGLEPDGRFNRIYARVGIDGARDGVAILKIPELGLAAEIRVKDGQGAVSLPAAPELWSPGHPKLYDVSVEFGSDKLTERIGFREIRAEGREILLNGKSIFLKGVCAHEESVTNGKSVTEEEIRENYALAKEMNCNFMRLAHYPHSEAAARIADEAGILLWAEIPVYWAIEFDDPAVYADAENQLTALIARDINRASVILWSVGNENADTDARLAFMGALADKARALDGTRLISAACLVDHEKLEITDRLAEKIDVIGINEYYGWYDPDFSKLPRMFANSQPQKPVIISEFGADAKAGHHGPREEMYSEEFQLAVYEKQLETLSAIDYVKGISPWIFFDFRCPRRLHFMQNHYNLKGLLSADKQHRKLAFYAMQRFYGRD
ncbi:MAG: glycoside hydrolase family 2 [Oscillospiraceae bacterium]|nr:glycoside hydrolase family 2 [Oscillospiraceae bacterium]